MAVTPSKLSNLNQNDSNNNSNIISHLIEINEDGLGNNFTTEGEICKNEHFTSYIKVDQLDSLIEEEGSKYFERLNREYDAWLYLLLFINK